ncbi:MAG: chitobiase/beta-hexosaminidase C-terminal domain-containing protein [Prevotella sp.]|uniref:chitobiase/beta-hexosaminidase C-terminal domain-containing protein n=1 Tax=Prevotella sp. TaxID=59823 RepID=UPI002A2E0047|nr:chitobiase/beta-hexosaminidase C-terminal domain-containing protein [Prevotella sp.]MDD7318624.1 chitobiase/beta-hexosaminidase C-terminal domain-containing protein [Prevotellaceae bacterium]MDY4019420.1 chitobiase/beta-hexosaminidase C-terminal domain-containing protein [Prevotella sp.]
MMKSLRTLCLLLFIAISTAGFAEEQTYTMSFKNKSAGGTGFMNSTDTKVTTATAVINGVEWTLVSDSHYMFYNVTNGQQIGSTNNPAHNAIISTEGIEGNIKSVTITARAKDGSTSSLAVKVGGENYKVGDSTAVSLPKANTEFTFMPPQEARSGKIEFLFEQEDNSKAGAMYLFSAVVVYEENTTPEPETTPATWTHVWNKTKADGGEGFYNFGYNKTEEMPLSTTLNGITWFAQAEGTTTFAMTAFGGQLIGFGTNDAATHAEFWTDGIKGKVTDITVQARLAKADYAGHIKVSVGGVTYLYSGEETAAMSASLKEYKFEAPASGQGEGRIKVEFFQTSETRGVIYLKSLLINYLEVSGGGTVVTAPADPVIARENGETTNHLTADEDIVITTETADAKIYYTLDAVDAVTPKDPKTSEERVEYTAPIHVTKSVLIKAVAFKGDEYSNVVERKLFMSKNPELSLEGNQENVTVETGYVGIPVALNNPHNVAPIEWNSENKEIATVDADGTIHALKEGKVNINYYFNGNDEYMEMGGRIILTVEKAGEYTTGTYTHIWDKSKSEGGEGFYNFGTTFQDTNTLTAVLNGVSWTATTVGSKKMMFLASLGQAFGVSTSDPCSHIEMVTNGISGEITEVRVAAGKGTTSHALSNAALKVSVGGTPYKHNAAETVALTGDKVEYSFIPDATPQEGEIKIEVNQDSETQVVIYFKSIVVNYRNELSDVEMPQASVEAGTYDEAKSVELTAQEGATILYTVDGSSPKTSAEAKTYTEPIQISATTTLKAIAKVGEKYSEVAEFKYVIRKDPELSFETDRLTVEYRDAEPCLGAYLNNPHNVGPITYSSSDESVVVLDNYADLLTIKPGEATITATFEGNDEYKPGIASYVVVVNPVAPLLTPTVSPAGGTFASPVEVTLTAASDWGTRAVTLWYSTTADTQEEMESDPSKRTVWPATPDFDYSVNSTKITIDSSCRLIVVAKGYNSATSEAVICDFVIDATMGITDVTTESLLGSKQVYNLQGQRVGTPLKGGVYIVDGKKVVVK